MRYTATLAGEALAAGDLQEVQAASAEALTNLLAEDPDGASVGVLTANRHFQDGTVARDVREHGQWRCPLWVNGKSKALVVTGEGS